MNLDDIKKLLEEVAAGAKSPACALEALRDLPHADLEVAKHDVHRELRNGFSEVIMCEGKDTEHLLKIVGGLAQRELNVFGTRLGGGVAKVLAEKFPKAQIDPVSRTFSLICRRVTPVEGRLAILCAGTADMSVAEEARQTALFFGIEAETFYDVGVAGLHRIVGVMPRLREMDAAIIVAGMEGALPSVVGGLVSIPVIAVPTSVGYGTNFKGVTALLAMLNSCSEGIMVVNIDNGFGAACAALRILRSKQPKNL